MEAQLTLSAWRRVSFHKKTKQSKSHDERQLEWAEENQSKRRRVGKITCQPCGLMPVCQN